MKASVNDLFVLLVPSTLVTGTVKLLDIRVRTTRTTSGAKPLQPSSGKRTVETNPNSNMIAPTTTTAASSDRLFQLNFDMNFSETFAGEHELVEEHRAIEGGLPIEDISQQAWPHRE